MSLSELQLWFSEKIRADANSPLVGAESYVSGSSRLSPNEQLEVYREQFWLRHEGALEEDFRGLVRVLSPDEFSRLVVDFLTKFPPETPSLVPLGEKLPSFARETFREAPNGECLAELTELDWSFSKAFVADDSPPLDLAGLSSLSPEAWSSARVELTTSLALHEFEFPVHEYRRALLNSEGDVAPPARRRAFIAVFRSRDFALFDRELPESAYRILVALRNGTPLLAACESVAALNRSFGEEIEKNLQAWFAEFASLGFISRVILGGEGLGSPSNS